jgi:hypothetical protein
MIRGGQTTMQATFGNTMRAALLAGMLGLGAAPGSVVASEDKNEPPPGKDRLEEILQGYEKTRRAMRTMHYKFTRTDWDRTFDTKTVFRGEVFLLPPSLLLVIERTEKGVPSSFVLCKDKTVYRYWVEQKREHVYEVTMDLHCEDKVLLRLKLWQNELAKGMYDCVTGTYGRLPIDEVKARFRVRLEKEDRYGAYLELLGRNPEDWAPVKRCEVVLDKETYWVRRISRELVNSNLTIWDFEKPDTKRPITWQSIWQELPQVWRDRLLPPVPEDQQEQPRPMPKK